ncbi:uncharacterized protein LOC131684750 [Topomyia yanbarensis]|uniref:uncharacterized protein LOC131684750 n=1 Tax=Topomyia yanbarensis TaxID=2498891 RepID=UPI00273C6E6E|nr:uncharacterized protein LOC131684750 [Topomyia yanbarensis]
MTFDGTLSESNQSSLRRSENASRENNPSHSSAAHVNHSAIVPFNKQQAPPPTTTSVSAQVGSTPRPAYLYYCSDDSDTAAATAANRGQCDQPRSPHLLLRQVNWNFYTDCKDDHHQPNPRRGPPTTSQRPSPPPSLSFPLLPQTEEALKLLREIDGNIAAEARFGDNGFGTLLLDNDNCGSGGAVNRDDSMSHYLRDDPRSVFFNQHPGPSKDSDPKASSSVEEPTPSTSSAFDSGSMLKRPTFASNTPSLSGFGNSKPIASSLGASNNLYQGQPPRIIGSTSANFGGPTVIHHKISIEPRTTTTATADSSKITFRPSPTSSTATTTPTSTAPGSGTHRPVETQMPTNRNSASGGGSVAPAVGGVTNHTVNSSNVSNNSAPPHGGSVGKNHNNGETGGGKVTPRFAAVTQQSIGSAAAGVQLTLYGWRKKCLYTVILMLMIMIIINLALTLWILKVMEFSSDGMGQLKIVSGGIQLTGQALVLDILRASSIRSKHGQPISIESSRNFSINTRDSEGYLENQLFLGHDRLEVLANNFRVTDTHGTSLFSVDRDEVSIGATALRVEGEGGVIFKDSIQTPLVRAEAGKDLKLESPTRSLEMRATQEIFVQSRAGSIEANCLNDLKLHSVAGSIRLDATNILLPNLKTVQPLSTSVSSGSLLREHGGVGGGSSASSSSLPSHSKIYQLCACSNGKLFLAPAHSICATDDSAICR